MASLTVIDRAAHDDLTEGGMGRVGWGSVPVKDVANRRDGNREQTCQRKEEMEHLG